MKQVDLYKVEGAEIKREKNGLLIVGFSSQSIINKQLMELNSVSEDFFLAFHGCNFSECDLNLIDNPNIKHIGAFYSSFGDEEMKVLSKLVNIVSVKLQDTKVTARCIFEIRQMNNKLKIYY